MCYQGDAVEILHMQIPDSIDPYVGGNALQKRALDVTFAVASDIFQSQENMRQATNKALTVTVPEAYRRAGGNVGASAPNPTPTPTRHNDATATKMPSERTTMNQPHKPAPSDDQDSIIPGNPPDGDDEMPDIRPNLQTKRKVGAASTSSLESQDLLEDKRCTMLFFVPPFIATADCKCMIMRHLAPQE